MKKLLFLILASSLVLGGCGGGNNSSSNENNGGSDKELLGAGSTFGYPIYSKMFSEYNTKTGVKTNYQSIGSGGGIKQLLSKTVDFGATDAFLNDEKIKEAGAPIVHIPTCLGAVVMSYNIPGNPKLKLTPEIIGGIYMGTIKKWNDPMIAKENAGTTLPDLGIMVVHRSDGSGTSFIFTDYLSKVYPDWKSKVGSGTSVNWPAGIGGKGNEGVAAQIKQTPGAIGYVELVYATKNNMSYADVKNAAGKYITPSLQSVSAAANIDIPADTRITITNSPAADAYPISSFTWIIIYKELKYNNNSEAKAKQLVNLLWYVTHDAQQYCEPLQYAKLSDKAVAAVEAALKSVTFDGKPVMTENPK